VIKCNETKLNLMRRKKMKRNGTKYNEISVLQLLGRISTLYENNTTCASDSKKKQKARTEGKF
jgi:hypothetical protein